MVAIGQNDSKAQGFSITFGGGPGITDPITAAITIRDIISTLVQTTTIAITTIIIIIVAITDGIIGGIGNEPREN